MGPFFEDGSLVHEGSGSDHLLQKSVMMPKIVGGIS